jgi:hypothetical protein
MPSSLIGYLFLKIVYSHLRRHTFHSECAFHSRVNNVCIKSDRRPRVNGQLQNENDLVPRMMSVGYCL